MAVRAAAGSGITHKRTHRSPITTAQVTPPPPVTILRGYFSLLAFWMGGAGR